MAAASDSKTLIEQGLFHHRAGQLALAMQRYNDALRLDAQQPDALYYVAVIACQEGQYEQGIALARRALEHGARQARVHNLLGKALERQGQHLEAVKSFEAAIAIDADFAEAHSNRADTLVNLGRRDEALAAYDRALELCAESPGEWCNRALLLADLGRADDALASYRRAIDLRPDFAEAYFNRADLLRRLQRMAEALDDYERAAALRPDFAGAHVDCALALNHLGRHQEALASINRALALHPDDPNIIVDRGHILRQMQQYELADADYARALQIDPNLSAAYLGRCNIRFDQCHFAEARAFADKAFALAPDAPETRNNLAYLQLMAGEWEDGWKNYESRGQISNPAYSSIPFPRWHGEPLAGERLVVKTEQGMGDAIHFSRFACLLAERGFDVTVLTTPELGGLLSTLANVTVATSLADLNRDKRPIRWVPMMSLPGIFGVRPETIPDRVPYLSADARRVETFAERLRGDGFKIGICWKSGPLGHFISRARDIPLAEFAPLADIPGVRLISLQIGPGLDEISRVGFAGRIERLDSSLRDWTDTAAAMMNLDLIVSCDTAIPHLAGALARPTLLAIPVNACWRWLTGRDDTSWYPTVRLFRQHAPQQWAPVFKRIAAAVRERMAARRDVSTQVAN